MSIKVLSRISTLAASPAKNMAAIKATLALTVKALAKYPLSLAYVKKTFTPTVLQDILDAESEPTIKEGLVLGFDDHALDVIDGLESPNAKVRKEIADFLDMKGEEEYIDPLAMFFAGKNNPASAEFVPLQLE